MNKLAMFLGLILAVPLASAAEEEKREVHLYVPDGQLSSHLVRVYINCDITEEMEPGLILHVSHALTRVHKGESSTNGVFRLSRQYRWPEAAGARESGGMGTLLLFNLKDFPIPFYKAMLRVTPTMVWHDDKGKHTVVASSEVYIGNTQAAVAWSALTIIVVGIFLAWISWQATHSKNPPARGRCLAAVCNADGTLSLWRLQLAAWTMAVGGVVLGFALIRLEVPQIPETLVALMGLSLVTGGLSALRQPDPATPAKMQVPAEGAVTGGTMHLERGGAGEQKLLGPVTGDPLPGMHETPTGFTRKAAPAYRKYVAQFADLITNFNRETHEKEVSLAKAQMVFWTVLMLAVFLVKSVLDGTLWPVPWQMVALMGMSQAGYVAPKFAPDARRVAAGT